MPERPARSRVLLLRRGLASHRCYHLAAKQKHRHPQLHQLRPKGLRHGRPRRSSRLARGRSRRSRRARRPLRPPHRRPEPHQRRRVPPCQLCSRRDHFSRHEQRQSPHTRPTRHGQLLPHPRQGPGHIRWPVHRLRHRWPRCELVWRAAAVAVAVAEPTRAGEGVAAAARRPRRRRRAASAVLVGRRPKVVAAVPATPATPVDAAHRRTGPQHLDARANAARTPRPIGALSVGAACASRRPAGAASPPALRACDVPRPRQGGRRRHPIQATSARRWRFGSTTPRTT